MADLSNEELLIAFLKADEQDCEAVYEKAKDALLQRGRELLKARAPREPMLLTTYERAGRIYLISYADTVAEIKADRADLVAWLLHKIAADLDTKALVAAADAYVSYAKAHPKIIIYDRLADTIRAYLSALHKPSEEVAGMVKARDEERDRRYREQRDKERPKWYATEMLKIIRQIAEEHNDPASLCRKFLKNYDKT